MEMVANRPSLSTKNMPLVDPRNRCEAGCPAAGMVTVTKDIFEQIIQGELTFCAHHFTKNEPALIAQGWIVSADSRATLTARETEVHA